MKIELHTITACGFYQRGCKMPSFGVAREWLGDFVQWINQRINIVATKTFDPQGDEAEIYCIFCVGDGQQQGVGIALWHGVPATETGVAYINRSAPPGYATASEQALPHGSIAGWPSYYWILPERNQIPESVKKVQ